MTLNIKNSRALINVRTVQSVQSIFKVNFKKRSLSSSFSIDDSAAKNASGVADVFVVLQDSDQFLLSVTQRSLMMLASGECIE